MKSGNIEQVTEFILHNLNVNRITGSKLPTCVWGRHGIGKTELVEQIASENGYMSKYVSLAEFQEMGDLVGMPDRTDTKTIYKMPEWAPDEPGPGILIIDDFNRAEDHILRGLMQFLLKYKFVSWGLPEGWDIVLTANPSQGYSVTEIDDAIMDRMRHIELEFNLNSWLNWATKNNIDSRGIRWIQSYPELFNDSNTSPRGVTHFLNAISTIKDLKAKSQLVYLLAHSSLDETAATSFITYVNSETQLPDVTDIINSFEKCEYILKTEFVDKNNIIKADVINILTDRLIDYMIENKQSITTENISNVIQYLALDIPADIIVNAFVRLNECNFGLFKKITTNDYLCNKLVSERIDNRNKFNFIYHTLEEEEDFFA